MPPSKVRALPDGRALVALLVVLDLTAVDFIDSSGLTMLIRVRQITEDRGGSLVLTGAGEALAHLLSLTRLDELFVIRPRADE